MFKGNIEPTAEKQRDLGSDVERRFVRWLIRNVGVRTELRVRHVSVEVMSATGPLYSAEDTGPGDTR